MGTRITTTITPVRQRLQQQKLLLSSSMMCCVHTGQVAPTPCNILSPHLGTCTAGLFHNTVPYSNQMSCHGNGWYSGTSLPGALTDVAAANCMVDHDVESRHKQTTLTPAGQHQETWQNWIACSTQAHCPHNRQGARASLLGQYCWC